jgi:polyisoprenyl-teichoic acid--peptidoglycan teichoic acid transferase
MNNTRIRKKKKKKVKKWFLLTLFSFFTLLIGGGLYFFNVYNDVASAVDNMNKPISREVSEKREEKVEVTKKDPISILMVGIDERDGDNGRTDSMLVLTVNPETNSTKILSIPRDTRTELIDPEDPDNSSKDKINHAYAYGGIEMSIATVENFLNIPIDYYVEINMEGFKDVVDAVNGIDVDNQYAFELDGITLEEGPQHLDGTETLAYARMRKQDPRGDIGRGERQREVISKIIDKGKSLSTLTNYNDILDALENNIKTNLTLNEIIDMQSSYRPAADTLEKLEVAGSGGYVGDVWYYMVEDETRQSLSDQLRQHLNLPTEIVAEVAAN